MAEGGLGAPMRRPIAWQDPDFHDPDKIDKELRRVFDICHGCRRCFNLCDSFPRLFDLVDASATGEVDGVASADFKQVIDACTLCDMCFMTKCPYVPPHEFDLDFPHLMLRYRIAAAKRGEGSLADRELSRMDRNAKLARPLAPLANWATGCGNHLTRPLMEAVLGVHRDAALPQYQRKTLEMRAAEAPFPVNREAPAFGRKAVVYATCFANYNSPDIGMAALAVLAHNGIEAEVVYPGCCGMPQLEQGDVERVVAGARKVALELKPWIEKGYDVVSIVPSCSLMLKFEWPLLLPLDEDVRRLSAATKDVSEYLVAIAAREGLAPGLKPLPNGITVHIACHARAQNVGRKGADLLNLIPDTKVAVIERCSGHGGSWGIKKDNFEVALKVGKPVARQAAQNAHPIMVSECPLAREHIVQGMEKLGEDSSKLESLQHPIQVFARAYGF